MKLQFKFNPSMRRELAPGDRRLWLLRSVALRIEKQANPLWRFEVYHRRLLLGLAALALAGWLAAATALFFWLDRQAHNQVGWFDLAAPWHWSGLRAKRGDTAVLAGLADLRDRDYASAFYNLRVGLARSPGNIEGRLMLARMFAGHDPTQAVTILEEGLPYAGDDPKLIGALLGFYGMYQMHSAGLAMVEDRLRAPAGSPFTATRLILERARVGFLLQLGRPAEASVAFAAIPPPADPAAQADLTVMHSEILLRSGQAAGAKALLAPLLAQRVVEPGTWRQAAEIAVAEGDADGLQSALRRLKAAAPESPGAYLLAVQAWHRMKRASLCDGAEQEYYRVFSNNDGALQALAALAVVLDLPDVVARAQRVAGAARLSPFAFQVHRTELALRRGEIEMATRFLRSWENDVDTLKAGHRFHPEFIKRLARAAFAGTPDQITYLVAHLVAARGQAQLPVYLLAATVLEKVGNSGGAAEVVRAGLQIYSRSEPLLVAQVSLAAATEVAGTAAEVTGPPAVAFTLLPATAAEARRQLDQFLQEDSLVRARDLLRTIRTQKPAWLPAIETDLSVREIELAYLTLDQIASRTVARAHLDRHRGEVALLELVAVAQRLATRGQLAEARLLIDEIKAVSSITPRVQQALGNLAAVDDTAPSLTSQASSLAALDGHVLAQQWAQAENLLRRIRDNPPPWQASGATEITVREVQVKLGLMQRPLALAALKELVVKGGAPRSAAFKLVRDLLARGDHETALLLAREVGRLMPGDPAAARLLREAEAPQPVAP